MKKLFSMLSLAAIAVSALFVSCAQPQGVTLVPAFPYNKTATFAQNEESGEWAWSYASGDKYTNALAVGFQAPNDNFKDDPDAEINHIYNSYLEYRMTPNADWSLEVKGNGKEYIEVYIKDGHFKPEQCTFGSTVSGIRGLSEFGWRVLKTPESYEEPVEVELALTMCGETMTIVTIVLEPAIW